MGPTRPTVEADEKVRKELMARFDLSKRDENLLKSVTFTSKPTGDGAPPEANDRAFTIPELLVLAILSYALFHSATELLW